MLTTLRTLISGANARAEEHVRDVYSIELIEQKIREATRSLKAAKVSLAGMIQRKRAEEAQIKSLHERIDDLAGRTKAALEAGQDAMARDAAQAIATMENECDLRRKTLSNLEARAFRLETSVETAHRRIEDLKQGAISARAIRREQDLQKRLGHTGDLTESAMDEAESLIARVMTREDPFEKSEILREIDTKLNHTDVADTLAEHGFGPSTKTTAADVLARFK